MWEFQEKVIQWRYAFIQMTEWYFLAVWWPQNWYWSQDALFSFFYWSMRSELENAFFQYIVEKPQRYPQRYFSLVAPLKILKSVCNFYERNVCSSPALWFTKSIFLVFLVCTPFQNIFAVIFSILIKPLTQKATRVDKWERVVKISSPGHIYKAKFMCFTLGSCSVEYNTKDQVECGKFESSIATCETVEWG